MRRRILIVLAIPLAGVAWWLGSPLFIDEAVDEDFPFSERAVIPDSMTRAQAEGLMADMAAQTHAATETMPDVEVVALKRGSFRDADRVHRGSGSATIYRLPDGSHLLRLEEFSVTNGPDLRVLLAVDTDPSARSDLESGGYVELARLKGNVGNQNYRIPVEVDVALQGSVVIYCRPFHVVFSVASLQ